MKSKLPVGFCRLLMGAAFLVVLFVNASAQISFIQVTDPHIFDDTWPEDSRREDKTGLVSCINQINQRVDAGANYSFVALTGDLGIEALVTDIDLSNTGLVNGKLQQGATELASMLAQSKVKRWFFVPGNNDVLKEIPENVKYYHLFMNLLGDTLRKMGSDISVVDLCPADNSNLAGDSYSSSGVEKLGDYAFIGFNDSSFKNSKEEDTGAKAATNPAARVEENYAIQKKYVDQVGEQLKRSDFKFAYIFYHIPEIDDPYFVTLKPTDKALQPRVKNQPLIGNSFFYSSWFVKSEVRDGWSQVVMNPRVKGLFAGHFHDPKQKSYDSFQWILTPSYVPESFSKLHVCPPLALRFQRDKDAKAMVEQARGFQEVYLAEDGSVANRIFWLSKTGWGLSSEAATAEAQVARQFELGDFYERNKQLKEAGAAYQKATDSTWPPTRQRALVSLTRVLNSDDSRLDKYVAAPLRAGWSTGVSALGALLPALILVSLLLILSPFVSWIGGQRGWDKLRIGPIVGSPVEGLGDSFEQVLIMIHGRMIVHYKRRPMLSGRQLLPMLARTQSDEVPEMVESAVPGIVGKVMVWLYKQSERPRYAITGAIQVSSVNSSAIFIALQESGRYVRTWHPGSSLDDVIQSEIKLSFDALRFLVMHMNKRHGQ
ncbi:MAG TPA: hypothetical protein VGO73_00800 [Pyrinomonadaceae bacterium]|nr:hypothetical protein [Pyrinomonadaceae bacterium]